MDQPGAWAKRRPTILNALVQLAWKKRYPIYLDYRISPKPRYGHGLPPHPILERIISEQRPAYEVVLKRFLQYRDAFERIALVPLPNGSTDPAWITGWFPPLDLISLYSFLSEGNPKRYFEIGSGNSTKVARRAIAEQKLDTKITSIDPSPRAEIDGICDRVIRKPVEDVPLSLFEELEKGDILLVDNSHRVFQNSDVTVCFLDIVPLLPEGVTVAFHDIYLPWDYSVEFGAVRHYSEQYLLAAYLLAKGSRIEVLLPNAFISRDADLLSILNPIWDVALLSTLKKEGSLFWIRT